MIRDGMFYVWVDFQKTDDSGLLVLTTTGSLADLQQARYDGNLEDQSRVRFYSDDEDSSGGQVILVVEGVLCRSQTGTWLGKFDPATFRHESPVRYPS
jgi:hypothetical protein